MCPGTYLEVLVEDLDLAGALLDGVLALRGPAELEAGAEGAVAPRQRGVDDVLAIATHNHKAAVRVVI